MAAQYEGLTSAYSAWQSAESAGSERDMYELFDDCVLEVYKTLYDITFKQEE